jgi:hypothetical protein
LAPQSCRFPLQNWLRLGVRPALALESSPLRLAYLVALVLEFRSQESSAEELPGSVDRWEEPAHRALGWQVLARQRVGWRSQDPVGQVRVFLPPIQRWGRLLLPVHQPPKPAELPGLQLRKLLRVPHGRFGEVQSSRLGIS